MRIADPNRATTQPTQMSRELHPSRLRAHSIHLTPQRPAYVLRRIALCKVHRCLLHSVPRTAPYRNKPFLARPQNRLSRKAATHGGTAPHRVAATRDYGRLGLMSSGVDPGHCLGSTRGPCGVDLRPSWVDLGSVWDGDLRWTWCKSWADPGPIWSRPRQIWGRDGADPGLQGRSKAAPRSICGRPEDNLRSIRVQIRRSSVGAQASSPVASSYASCTESCKNPCQEWTRRPEHVIAGTDSGKHRCNLHCAMRRSWFGCVWGGSRLVSLRRGGMGPKFEGGWIKNMAGIGLTELGL